MSSEIPAMSWQEQAVAKRASLAALIPDELKLPTLPGANVLNVTNYPLDSVLSTRDLEITDTADVGVLLEKMSTGVWSATEVTTAYCKRALAAHQLVINCSFGFGRKLLLMINDLGELSYRNFRRPSFSPGQRAR